MALNIRNPETDRLAREVASITGETKTEAVTRALEDRLARLRREVRGRTLADELDAIALHCSRFPSWTIVIQTRFLATTRRSSWLMVIDTSAVLAILQDEPERRAFNELIESAPTRAMSVASWVEASMVLQSRFGADGMRDLDRFLEAAQIELVPVSREHGDEAREAFRRFGRSEPHRVNFSLTVRAKIVGRKTARSCFGGTYGIACVLWLIALKILNAHCMKRASSTKNSWTNSRLAPTGGWLTLRLRASSDLRKRLSETA